MNDRQRYSRRDMQDILREAARLTDAPEQARGYSLQELQDAAREAGIEDRRVRQASRRVNDRRSLRTSLALVALGAAIITAALIVLPGRAGTGGSTSAVSLHNEHRSRAYTFEVLVPGPTGERTACAGRAATRLPANEYCLVQRFRLEPGRRARIAIPRRPRSCPQVWVRTFSGRRLERAAVFVLPAAIEVDRRGRLDQKGIGSPHMHPAPGGEVESPVACPTTTLRGAL